MQLALIILAGLGALLFIISYLGYVMSGFRHHFVTGLISSLPVLNIITLPSLWDKNGRKFMLGLVGLIIFSVAWFLGANKGIQQLFFNKGNPTTEEVVMSATPSNSGDGAVKTIDTTTQTTANSASQFSSSYNEDEMVDLPNKALYKMSFDVVPVSQIGTLQGRIVQIIKTDNELIEGRVKSVSPGSVILEGLFENELPLASIKQLKLMVKKAN